MTNSFAPPDTGGPTRFADMDTQEALDLANAIAARDRAIARTRNSRPITYREGGMSRIGPLMSAALASAFFAAFGPDEFSEGGRDQ